MKSTQCHCTEVYPKDLSAPITLFNYMLFEESCINAVRFDIFLSTGAIKAVNAKSDIYLIIYCHLRIVYHIALTCTG